MKTGSFGAAAAAGLTLFLLAGETRAQAWIGQIAGDAVAQQQAAAREEACRAGTPASPGDTENARVKTGELMAGYSNLTSRSRSRDIQKVFARTDDTTWADPAGAVPVLELGERLDASVPILTPVNFVIGGDAGTARGVWSAAGEDGTVTAWYAVDFLNTPGFWGGANWRVWHMTVFPADQQPEAPGAYCHYDPDQAWRIG